MIDPSDTTKPKSVDHAVTAIWLSNAASALVLWADYDDTNAETLVFNAMLLGFYAFVTFRIGSGNRAARLIYAFLVAAEVALLMAFGLSDASDLDVLLTYLTTPLEIWALFKLFGTDSDVWFKSKQKR